MLKNNIYFLLVLFAFGCGTSASNKETTENGASQATKEMIAKLAAHQQAMSPVDNGFENRARVNYFKSLLSNVKDPQERLQLNYLYCFELIKSGQYQQGIESINALIKYLGGNNPTTEINENNKPVFDMLAIAYLRLGEQDNCVMNNTGNSCIVPLQKDAMHKNKTGSTNAIEVFKKILVKFPNDYNSIWLLNIAYMTLDDYPRGVPAQWRLPESAFVSKGIIPRFENIAPQLGLNANSYAGGCCMEDFNGDGFLDIMISSWGLRDQMHLFVNNGDGSFTEKTEQAGLMGLTGGLNMIHADYNNDGFMDVLVLRGAWLGKNGKEPNSLLKNNGDGTFTDVTVAAGLFSEHPTQTAAWADFNLDGNLDLFIGNESGKSAPLENVSEFYLNNGNGTFTEGAAKLGLDVKLYVKGCVSADVDGNGYPDLFLSVFEGENKLFMNKGGTTLDDMKFEETGAKAGVVNPVNSFPTFFFDYDNDGHPDLFVSGYQFERFPFASEDEVRTILGLPVTAERPRLYHNNGNGTFTDVTQTSGVNRVMFGMGSNFGDINNDGFLDFYIGTGVPDLKSIVPNRMWLNQNGKSFVDVTYDGGFGQIQKGHGITFGDLDRDGDADIYQVIGGAYEGDNFKNELLNNPMNTNHWINIQLQGKTANRCAIGAIIHVNITENGKERNIYRTISTGGSFGSSTLECLIGLGQSSEINFIEVTWPNKNHTVQKFTGMEQGKKYLIVEGSEPTVASYKPFAWKLDQPAKMDMKMN